MGINASFAIFVLFDWTKGLYTFFDKDPSRPIKLKNLACFFRTSFLLCMLRS